MDQGIEEISTEFGEGGYVIYHVPTGTLYTPAAGPDSNFIESWSYDEASQRVYDPNDGSSYLMLDSWAENMKIFKTKKEAEEEVRWLLKNDTEIFLAGDTVEDFEVFFVKHVSLSGQALKLEQ